MNSKMLIAFVLAGRLAFDHGISMAHAETDICKRLKEFSSLDPTKELLWGRMSPEWICRGLYWSEFRPLPLSKILNAADLGEYRRATTGSDCTTAVALLSNRFAIAHPKALPILTNKENFKSWKRRTVGTYFPALALCFGLQRVREAQAEIDRLGISAKPYAGRKKSLASPEALGLPIPVQERHSAIFRLQLIQQSTKSRAITLALLKLSTEGKALKYHRFLEFYIALRLRRRGEPDPIVQRIIERPIDTRMRLDIKQMAISGNYEGLPVYPD